MRGDALHGSARRQLVKVGMLGGGLNSAVGRAHVSALRLIPSVSLDVGYFSRNEEVNARSAQEYGVTSLQASEDDFFKAASEVDLVVIVTPTPRHYEDVMRAVECSQAVVCEKSLVANYKQARKLHSVVSQTPGILSVIYNYTGYPMVREIRQMILRGSIGTPLHANFLMPQESYLKRDGRGAPVAPQRWRLEEQVPPMITLDLGMHLFNLSSFLKLSDPVKLVGIERSLGNFPEVVDDVTCLVDNGDLPFTRYWYSKAAVGHRNGLSFEIYGDDGSVVWMQQKPDEYVLATSRGDRKLLDRGSPQLQIASQSRYQRFKAGHPTGFVEALANYYEDVIFSLKSGEQSEFIFGIEDALRDLLIAEKVSESSTSGTWVNVPH